MHAIIKKICTFVLVITTATFIACCFASSASAQTVTIAPKRGPEGVPIKVRGSGFTPRSTVTIRYKGNGIIYDTITVTVDAGGNFGKPPAPNDVIIHASGVFFNLPYTVEATDDGKPAKSGSASFFQRAKAKSVEDLTPKSPNSNAESISNDETILGEHNVDDSSLGFTHAPATTVSRAFVIRNGVLQALGTLGGSNSAASAINKKGVIVGAAEISGDAETHAVIFNKDGTLKDLGTLGGKQSIAFGINDRGRIVGFSTFSGETSFHAFVYTAGALHDLGTLGGSNSTAHGINKSRQIVGTSHVQGNNASHAFLITKGSMKDLGTLGGSNSLGQSLNNNGDVTGYSNPKGSTDNHAFLYSNGTMKDLGTLGGKNSQAFGINSFGDVVGTAQIRRGGYHAVLYFRGNVLDLNTLLPPHSGWVLVSANSINDNGRIVGRENSSEKRKHSC